MRKFLLVSWLLPPCLAQHTWKCSFFSEVSDAKQDARLKALEGHCVSSKSPSRVRDQDGGWKRKVFSANDLLLKKTLGYLPDLFLRFRLFSLFLSSRRWGRSGVGHAEQSCPVIDCRRLRHTGCWLWECIGGCLLGQVGSLTQQYYSVNFLIFTT